MLPILLSIGSFHLYSLSVFLVMAWSLASFLFWRKLRDESTSEEGVFDLMFYGTIMAFVAARLVFVALHWELFSGSFLRIITIWVQPGLSWFGALFGALLTMMYGARRLKVRFGHILDAFAISLPAGLIVGKVGSLLDGTEVGTISSLSWAIRYAGHVGRRHPVQIYEMIFLLFLVILMRTIDKRADREQWSYGLVGVWFFLLYSIGMFLLELLKESRVYFWNVSVNQWALVILFAQSVGALYVRGGGREVLRPYVRNVRAVVSQGWSTLYEKISKRGSH